MTTPKAGDWTLVTVTYNSANHLKDCWSRAAVGDAAWIVVDNASQDDSAEVARSMGATVMLRKENGGFSRANNIGLARVSTKYVAFVNPDVVIPSPDDLLRLQQTSLAYGSLVAPQLLNDDGTEQLNARGFPFPGHKLANRGVRLPRVRLDDYARGDFEAPTYIAWAMGAAFAGPTALFRELGGWDERYFVYYEDHDIGLRSWRAGHPVVLDPSVRWSHLWQRATTKASFGPWKHEFESMKTFYSTYPGLAWRRLPGNRTQFGALAEKLWEPAESVG